MNSINVSKLTVSTDTAHLLQLRHLRLEISPSCEQQISDCVLCRQRLAIVVAIAGNLAFPRHLCNHFDVGIVPTRFEQDLRDALGLALQVYGHSIQYINALQGSVPSSIQNQPNPTAALRAPRFGPLQSGDKTGLSPDCSGPEPVLGKPPGR